MSEEQKKDESLPENWKYAPILNERKRKYVRKTRSMFEALETVCADLARVCQSGTSCPFYGVNTCPIPRMECKKVKTQDWITFYRKLPNDNRE